MTPITFALLLLLMAFSTLLVRAQSRPFNVSWMEPVSISVDPMTVMDLETLPVSRGSILVGRLATSQFVSGSPLGHKIVNKEILDGEHDYLSFVSKFDSDGLCAWTRLYTDSTSIIVSAPSNTLEEETSSITVAGKGFVHQVSIADGTSSLEYRNASLWFYDSCTDIVTGTVFLVGRNDYADDISSIIVMKIDSDDQYRPILVFESETASGVKKYGEKIAVHGNTILMLVSATGATAGTRIIAYNTITAGPVTIVAEGNFPLLTASKSNTAQFYYSDSSNLYYYNTTSYLPSQIPFVHSGAVNITSIDSFVSEGNDVLVVSGTVLGSATIVNTQISSSTVSDHSVFICQFTWNTMDDVNCKVISGRGAVPKLSVGPKGETTIVWNTDSTGVECDGLQLLDGHGTWIGRFVSQRIDHPMVIVSHDIEFNPIQFLSQTYLFNRRLDVKRGFNVESGATFIFDSGGWLWLWNSTASFLGTAVGKIQIHNVGTFSGRRIIVDSTSSISLRSVVVSGHDVSFVEVKGGGSIYMENVEILSAGAYAVTVFDPERAEFKLCTFNSTTTSRNPIVHIRVASTTSNNTVVFYKNKFIATSDNISYLSLEINGKNHATTFSHNEFEGGSMGSNIVVSSGSMRFTENKFLKVETPLTLIIYEMVLTIVEGNRFRECLNSVSIEKKNVGRLFIRGNKFQENSAHTVLHLTSELFCDRVMISGNELSNNTVTGQVVLLDFPSFCHDAAEFRNNELIDNDLQDGAYVVSVSGKVNLNRNKFQPTEQCIFNNGSTMVNAQFNYWGTTALRQVQVYSNNSSPLETKPTMTLYSPFLYENGTVVEHSIFTQEEEEALVDCVSVRQVWPSAISGVYRIKPLCESMYVYCSITNTQENIVLQRRGIRDTDFDVDYDSYESGFGNLDGDFFLGLQKISLLNKFASLIAIEFGAPSSIWIEGYMSLGPAGSYYPLSITTNQFTYTNVSFGTSDQHADDLTRECAKMHNSGWWFGNCTDELSWNLNGVIRSDIQSDNYISSNLGRHDNIVYSTLNLRTTSLDRNLLTCDPGRTCFGKEQYDPEVCSGHGLCNDNNICICHSGYGGRDCSFQNVTVGLNVMPPKKYCDDFVISVEVVGASGPLQYNWTIGFNNGLNPAINDVLASHHNNATLVIPGRYLSISVSTVSVEISDQNIREVQFAQIYTPLPTLVPENIDVSPVIVVPQFESYSITLKTKGLPICADMANKKWEVDEVPYETVANNPLTLRYQALYPHTHKIQLSFQSSTIEKDVVVVIIPASTNLIIAGGSRMVTAFHNHTIDASASYDKTVPSDSVPQFVWNCTGCKYFKPNNKSKEVFYEEKGEYVLKVLYYPDIRNPSRNASSEITLTVVDDLSDRPLPYFGTIIPNILDARKKLRIQPVVDRNRPNDYLEYMWVVLRRETNEQTVISGTSFNAVPLVLPEGFLNPNSSYVFTFRAKYTNFTLYGEAYAVSRTASAPTIGSSQCSPCTGSPLQTQFVFSVEATDRIENHPLQYSFSYLDPIADQFIPIQMASYISSVKCMLPNRKLKWMIVQAVVTNIYGVETTTQFNITLVEPQDVIHHIQELMNQQNSDYSSDMFTTIAGSLGSIENVNEANTFAMQLISSMSTILDKEVESTDISIDSAVVNINTIEILTELNMYSNESTITSSTHHLLDQVIDLCLSAKLELRDPFVKSLARSISNLMTRYTNEQLNETNTVIMPSIHKMSSLISTQMLVSENQTLISTDTYQLSVKKENGDTIRGIDISTEDTSVTIPRNLSLPTVEEFIIQSISFSYSFNPYQVENLNFSTPVLDFMIRHGEKKTKLSNLKHPLVIVLNKEIEKENASYKHQCRFMDETTNSAWLTTGCSLHSETDYTVTCHCDHTTSFSAMIIYDPKKPNKASDGLYITSIIINSLFALICTFLLVISFIWRRKQPIASRFLAPYIGLGAILIECILNGIIRNSLLIAANNAKDFRGVNSIAYLILTIVNPLVLLSLFIYCWQMWRYFFLKHLYSIMEKGNLKRIRLLKFISSKTVYVVLGIGIYVAACVYFVIISILEATNVIKPNAGSTVNALSFSLMSLVFGALIVATFMWDLSIILTRKVFKRENKKVNEGNAEAQYFKNIIRTIVNHFRSDDPLVFRIESIFMVMAILVMTVSYIVGITDRFDSGAHPNSAAKIIEFLFDILYLALRIMAFGGLTVLVRFIQRIKLHRQNEEYETLKQLVSDLKTGTSTIESQLLDLLRDEYGYQSLSTYAKKEFALENVLLWKRLEDVRMFNITATPDSRRQVLKQLYDDCIASGSPFECNLPFKTKKNYEGLLKRPNEELVASNTEELLLAVSNEVMVNICDTYTRFSTSPEYAQYLKVRELGRELSSIGDLPQSSSQLKLTSE